MSAPITTKLINTPAGVVVVTTHPAGPDHVEVDATLTTTVSIKVTQMAIVQEKERDLIAYAQQMATAKLLSTVLTPNDLMDIINRLRSVVGHAAQYCPSEEAYHQIQGDVGILMVKLQAIKDLVKEPWPEM